MGGHVSFVESSHLNLSDISIRAIYPNSPTFDDPRIETPGQALFLKKVI